MYFVQNDLFKIQYSVYIPVDPALELELQSITVITHVMEVWLRSKCDRWTETQKHALEDMLPGGKWNKGSNRKVIGSEKKYLWERKLTGMNMNAPAV